jgi:hypothetical protein
MYHFKTHDLPRGEVNKNFWEELICPLSLHKLTVNNYNTITSIQNFLQIDYRFKSCTHLRSLNVRHFGMAETTRLKMWRRGLFNGITFLPNFMKIHRSVQILLLGDTHTHTQAGDLISLFSFLKIRLKMLYAHKSHASAVCWKLKAMFKLTAIDLC